MAGGARPGAGRKKGGRNRAVVEREQKLAESARRMAAVLTNEQISAMSPLDVMLHAMKIDALAGEWRAAAAVAEKAAPYLHRKIVNEVMDLRNESATIDVSLDDAPEDPIDSSRNYQRLIGG